MSTLSDYFTSLANKIRSKTGKSTALTPTDMITEVDAVYQAGVESVTPGELTRTLLWETTDWRGTQTATDVTLSQSYRNFDYIEFVMTPDQTNALRMLIPASDLTVYWPLIGCMYLAEANRHYRVVYQNSNTSLHISDYDYDPSTTKNAYFKIMQINGLKVN